MPSRKTRPRAAARTAGPHPNPVASLVLQRHGDIEPEYAPTPGATDG
jgi:hypothetical protein